MAFVVDEEVPAEKVRQSISKAGGNLLAEVRLFDLYRGQPIPPGWKSLAYSLTFRAPDRTLTDKEVVALKERIRKHLERELGARLRE
jgi:phenylalanyl-tRNA synthetase beta chain